MNIGRNKRSHVVGISLLIVALLCPSGRLLQAAERPGIWITPFGGYRLNGSIPLDDPNYKELDLQDNPVYGLAVGMEVPQGLIEFMWTHHDSSVRAVPVMGGPPAQSLDLNTEQFHLNGLYIPEGYEQYWARPYAMGGIGMTRYAPVGNYTALNRFSWALGGGFLFSMTKRLGLRLEGKWNPALASSSGSVFCNSTTGTCFVSASGDIINQFDFTAGLTLRI